MNRSFRILVALLALTCVLLAGVAAGQQKFGTPKSVVHVVAVQWKADASEEQKQRAIDGLRKMVGEVPGIKNVWLVPDRVQPRGFTYAFAIEFESREAADAYSGHAAQQAWYEVYMPAREASHSVQVTNR